MQIKKGTASWKAINKLKETEIRKKILIEMMYFKKH